MAKNVSIDTGALLAIIFASIVISGSLVYFGMSSQGGGASVLAAGNSISDEYLDERIDAGIERYVERKTNEAEEEQAKAAAADAERTKAMAQNVPAVGADDHVYGNADAKFSLIEYSDFQCPFCQRFHATAKQVVEEYDGDVNWVYRHWPLPSHDPEATQQALASECVAELAGTEAFWAMGEAFFATGVSDLDGMTKVATGLGADEAEFRSCVESEKYLAKIKQQLADGANAGVSGTPGNILLNNETGEAVLVEGAQPFSVFQQILDPQV